MMLAMALQMKTLGNGNFHIFFTIQTLGDAKLNLVFDYFYFLKVIKH